MFCFVVTGAWTVITFLLLLVLVLLLVVVILYFFIKALLFLLSRIIYIYTSIFFGGGSDVVCKDMSIDPKSILGVVSCVFVSGIYYSLKAPVAAGITIPSLTVGRGLLGAKIYGFLTKHPIVVFYFAWSVTLSV